MLKRHMAMKQRYPDREPGQDVPYGGIENLRPETKSMIAPIAAMKKAKRAQ